jgi:hypothetical protein
MVASMLSLLSTQRRGEKVNDVHEGQGNYISEGSKYRFGCKHIGGEGG